MYSTYLHVFISLCVSRPNKKKDGNAVAVVTPNPDQVQRKRAVDLHPNILNKEFEVTFHVPKLMATWLTRFLKRKSNCGRVVIKEKRVNTRSDFDLKVPCEYIFEGDDLFCEWLHWKDRRGIYNVERCLDLHVFSIDCCRSE